MATDWSGAFKGGTVAQVKMEPSQYKPTDAVPVYASQIAIQSSGNDVILVFNVLRPHRFNSPPTDMSPKVVEEASVNVANIVLSPQSAKDLWLLVGGALEQFEADYGPISTPMMKNREPSGT